MAEGTEIENARALVLDANIMICGVFGTRVRALIERYANAVSLFTPQSCVDEVRKYIPPLCAKRGWDPAVALETLDALLTGIEIVESASLASGTDGTRNAHRQVPGLPQAVWSGSISMSLHSVR